MVFHRARAEADHQYTMPAGHTMASYTTSTGTRSSNTYDYIPYATASSPSASAVECSDGGFLNPMANDDYLKPVDGVVYYSIKDDTAKLAALYDSQASKPLL